MLDTETQELLRQIDTLSREMKSALGGVTAGREDDRKAFNARISEIEQKIIRRGGSGGLGGGGNVEKTWGQSLIESEEFKTLAASSSQRGEARVQIKTVQTLTSTVGGLGLVAPDIRVDPVLLPRRVPTVRSLLAPGVTSSNTVYYPRQTLRTNNAAVVSEGALKPQSEIDFEQKQAPVTTIATFVLASRQILDDAPALQSTIDGELRYMLDFAEEVELLSGDGTGAHLLGLIPSATAFVAPFPNPGLYQNADVLLQAIGQTAQALLPATGIILNTIDWLKLLALKTTIGEYLSNGPFGPLQARMLWDLPTVPTLAMPAGFFMVGAFGIAAQIFDRLEAEILASTEDSDNFRRNLVTLRAEKRLALAIKRPQALIYGAFPYANQRGRSAGTIRRELGVLRAAINHAHREGRMTRVVAVHLPDRPDAKDRWLTRREAAALLRAALREPRVRLYLPLFIMIGLYTGARKEAILSLRWPQVDVDAGRIDFNAPGARRTNKRRARIPVPARLLGHLRRARARGVDLGFVVNDNGLRLGDVKRGFASACRRAGLAKVTPHTLKHTCATWLCQRGVPTWEIAGFLATSRETIERVYGHHHPDYLKSAAEALG